MIDGLIGTLIVAWILSIFGFDTIVVKGINELFNLTVTTNSYYLIAAVIGLVAGAFNR